MGFVECNPYWSKRSGSANGRNGFTSLLGFIWYVYFKVIMKHVFYFIFQRHEVFGELAFKRKSQTA